MSKPPAFQFYPDDFIGGTVALTTVEVGAYVRLLCYQWGQGKIPDAKEAVDRIAGAPVTDQVLSKFPNGRNKRLELERKKQKDYREKQRLNGLASGRARRSTKPQRPLNGGSTKPEPRVVDVSLEPNTNSPSPSPSPSTDLSLVPAQAAEIGSAVNPPVDSNWPQRIESIHGWYAEHMGIASALDSGRTMQWMAWFKAGYDEDDFKRVLKYLRGEVEQARRNPGSLKLSNLLIPDAFGEDLMLAKQQFKGGKQKSAGQPLWAQIEASEKLLAEVSARLKRTEIPNVLAYEKGEKNPRYKTDFEKAVNARAALVDEKKTINDRLAELRRRQAEGEA